MPYNGPERRAPDTFIEGQGTFASINEGWHLKKEVSLGMIGALMLNIVALVGAYYTVVGRVDLLQADAYVLHQTDSRMYADNVEAMKALREQYKEVNTKLDRLIERGMR